MCERESEEPPPSPFSEQVCVTVCEREREREREGEREERESCNVQVGCLSIPQIDLTAGGGEVTTHRGPSTDTQPHP